MKTKHPNASSPSSKNAPDKGNAQVHAGDNSMTPQRAVERLIEGNRRFINGLRSVDSMLAHLKMADLAANGQKPFAVVLTCSDSRSPAEMIFDQGLGDLFVVRVAGNVVAPSLLASIEFAISNFGSSTVLVLGHTQCGAIAATVQHTRQPAKALPSPHLEELVGRIRPAVEEAQRHVDSHKNTNHDHDSHETDFVHLATVENVQRSVRLIIDQSAIVRDLIKKGTLSVGGALLNISNGSVELIT